TCNVGNLVTQDQCAAGDLSGKHNNLLNASSASWPLDQRWRVRRDAATVLFGPNAVDGRSVQVQLASGGFSCATLKTVPVPGAVRRLRARFSSPSVLTGSVTFTSYFSDPLPQASIHVRVAGVSTTSSIGWYIASSP